MAEFTAITTQEAFDAAIKARLERQENTIRKEYADYDQLKQAGAELEAYKKSAAAKAQEDADKIAGLKESLKEANAKIKSFEIEALKAAAADQVGLPASLRTRINGGTKEEIEADAKALYEAFSAQNRQGLPGFSPEAPKSGGDAAYLELLNGLHLEEK